MQFKTERPQSDNSVKILIASASRHKRLGDIALYRSMIKPIPPPTKLDEIGYDCSWRTLTHKGHLVNVVLEIALDNHDNLSVVYNRMLAKYRDGYDYIIFIHDDVHIQDFENMIHDVLESPWALTGAAGAYQVDPQVSPFGWFSASNTQHRYGAIYHPKYLSAPVNLYMPEGPFRTTNEYITSLAFYGGGELDGDKITKTNPYYDIRGNVYNKCICIDGVFMALDKSILKSQLLFDEQFKFDFYDMDFSFATYSHIGSSSIGACSSFKLLHMSEGLGILKQEYLNNETLFRKKWNLGKTPLNTNSRIVNVYRETASDHKFSI